MRGSPGSHEIRLDWGAVYLRYQAVVQRFAEGIVRQRELAEDLVQEAFHSVVRRAEQGELHVTSSTHARNYLFRTVHNLCVDALRSPAHARARELEPTEAVPARGPRPLESLLDAEERQELVQQRREVEHAIAALRPLEREAVSLRYGDGLTYREMAERTGQSISTLQGRVEAALDKIRRKVGKHGSSP